MPRKRLERAIALSRRKGDKSAGFLLEAVIADVVERMAAILRDFERIAIVGDPGGLAARRIAALRPGSQIMEICGAFLPGDGQRIIADCETLPLPPRSVDLIVHLCALQWTNDPVGVLVQARHALRPDGLFLGAFPGGETLAPLRDAFLIADSEAGGAVPRVHPMVDVRTAGGLLQRAGLALPVTDSDRIMVRYRDGLSLLADLRGMGATNMLDARDRRGLRRSVLMRAMSLLAESAGQADGRIAIPFEIVSVSGWAPHESQQQPLKPGSAKTRLATALGQVERSAGEKAGSERVGGEKARG